MPAVMGVLARAEMWVAMTDGEVIRNRSQLASHLGVSRARVSQALGVLGVPGSVMEVLKRAEAAGAPVEERPWPRIRELTEREAIGLLAEMGFT